MTTPPPGFWLLAHEFASRAEVQVTDLAEAATPEQNIGLAQAFGLLGIVQQLAEIRAALWLHHVATDPLSGCAGGSS